MVKAAAIARTTPTVYVIEDAHWIDEISESMLAELLTVVPRTRSLVLVTYRPEYDGALAHAPRSQTIALEPLDESQMLALGAELLGEDRSVTELAELIAERAAGNPFFAEEIVRDLSERDVLVGGRGCYLCVDPIGNVHVPGTLQAVIAARIDRLDPAAKRTLNAAAVIGSRFTPDMLQALGIEAALDDLVSAELIDQTAFHPQPEYAFRHPLIRAVAYESQLKSDRAQLHKRVSAAIDQTDQNAALIAEHLEAAGDLHGAYEWHMRGGAWSHNRDHAAASLSWERAIQAADAMPADEPGVLSMRIAPRSLLCSNAFRRFHPESARFDELRALCTVAGDKASLAIGTAGLVMEHIIRGRQQEASQLASENMALIDSIGDPALTVALSFTSCVAKLQVAEMEDVLLLSTAVIDVADGESAAERIILGSPLAMALAFRSVAKWTIGLPGWREDMRRAMSMSRTADTVSQVAVITYCYQALAHGVLLADDSALAEIGTAMQAAERSAEDIAVVLIRMMLGFALVERGAADVDRGYDIFAEICATCAKERYAMNLVPSLRMFPARQMTARGDFDGAIAHARTALDEVFSSSNFFNFNWGTNTLVEALLARGTENDLNEAEAAIARLVNTLPGNRWAVRDVYVYRLSALLAHARGDDSGYRGFRDRYRAIADDLGYERHMAWAAEMP